MRRLPRNPWFWLAGFLLWFGVLWMLSSSANPATIQVPINHFDKVAHFGYFFGGGGLLSTFFFRLRPERPNWSLILTSAIIVIALCGMLDEWHQSFTPGRSGNDPYDWLADVLGATVGAFTLKRVHHRLK